MQGDEVPHPVKAWQQAHHIAARETAVASQVGTLCAGQHLDRRRASQLAYGDVGAVIAGEEESGTSLLDRFAESTHGHVHETSIPLLLRVEEVHQQSCTLDLT